MKLNQLTEYLEVVKRSLSRYNETCANNVADGFDEVVRLIATTEGRNELSKTFR